MGMFVVPVTVRFALQDSDLAVDCQFFPVFIRCLCQYRINRLHTNRLRPTSTPCSYYGPAPINLNFPDVSKAIVDKYYSRPYLHKKTGQTNTHRKQWQFTIET